jgi:hypothetical protein
MTSQTETPGRPKRSRTAKVFVPVAIISAAVAYTVYESYKSWQSAHPRTSAAVAPFVPCPDAPTYEIRMLALNRAHAEVERLRERYQRSFAWWKLPDADRKRATDQEMEALASRLLAQAAADTKMREAFVNKFGASCGEVFDDDFAGANKISEIEQLSDEFVPSAILELRPSPTSKGN